RAASDGAARGYRPALVFASAGISTLVEPTLLNSIVVVRSISRSSPLKFTVPWTVYFTLVRAPSLIVYAISPLGFFGAGGACPPAPPRRPKVSSSLAPS